MALLNLGWVLSSARRFDEAETLTRQALTMQRKLFCDGHPSILLSLRNLGLILKSEEKLPEAEAAHREALAGDRFWNEFAAHPDRIDEDTRTHYAALYARPGAMRSGFAQFRAFTQDAE